MQLKQFEAGRYDNDHVIIRNPENDFIELFSEEQFEIVKFLKQNESETLLALLLPNIGIAKKTHIILCLKVLAKLKKMQIVDYFSIIGKFNLSNTDTIELAPKKKIKFDGINSLLIFFFGIFEKIFSLLGTNFLLFFLFIATILSIWSFPVNQIQGELNESRFLYGKFFLTIYLVGSLSFSVRTLFQSAYLKASGREMKERGFGFYFPFIGLAGKVDDLWLTGYQSRMQMAVMGLFSPLALSLIFTVLTKLSIISAFTGFVGFSTCIGVSLVLLCPIFSYDMAEILHVLFYRGILKESISQQMKEIFKIRGSLNKAMLVALLFTLGWLFLWLDSIRVFWDQIAAQVVADIFDKVSMRTFIGGIATSVLFAGLLFVPVLIFVVNLFRERIKSRGTRLVVKSEKVKDSLTFEERMTALEKIPLFAYLNDQERLALLNQMSVAFYEDGNFLVHQGEVGKEFLILVKGRASALFTGPDGKVLQLANLHEGDAFGEIALIDDVPRTASIVSEGGCIVLVLKKDGFDRFVEGIGSPDKIKTMIRLTSFFRRHPLFSKLSAKDQAELIDEFQFHTLLAGDEVVGVENDENFYVIYSGKVRVDTGDDSSEAFLESDDCFGYTKALGAKYFAVEGTGLLSVPTELFHKLIWEKLVAKPELFI